jgi:hypothetical protein
MGLGCFYHHKLCEFDRYRTKQFVTTENTVYGNNCYTAGMGVSIRCNMKKQIRILAGGLFTALGFIFFILPGSMFVLLLGLLMLSYDFPKARHWLGICQKSMAKSARKLDKFLLDHKLKH